MAVSLARHRVPWVRPALVPRGLASVRYRSGPPVPGRLCARPGRWTISTSCDESATA
jgi:hypothetical protein